MRILHLIGSMDPTTGGPCQGVRSSNAEMAKLGIHREVVCLDDPDSSYLGMDPFTIHALGKGSGPWQYNPKLKPWLEENLERFDVVIINGLWLYLDYIAWVCIRRFRKRAQRPGSHHNEIKLFIMPHGMLDPYFQKAPERKLKAIRNWLYWKLIENRLVNSADALLFTCETELLLAREAFTPYHPQKEMNVGYGVQPPPAFQPSMKQAFFQICPALSSQPYLLFLSRIHEKKGVDLLVKAYIQLQEKYAGTGTLIPKLVIAGPGLDTVYGQKIKKMAGSGQQTCESIFFPGMLTGEAKWGAFYGAEAFVLSSHQENFGIAVAEALACSKPVLISDKVNIWREINGAAGGIVETDTVEGTEKMLEQWILLSPQQRLQMGENAFQAYQNHFDMKNVARSFIDAISSVVDFSRFVSLQAG